MADCADLIGIKGQSCAAIVCCSSLNVIDSIYYDSCQLLTKSRPQAVFILYTGYCKLRPLQDVTVAFEHLHNVIGSCLSIGLTVAQLRPTSTSIVLRSTLHL